MVRGRHARRKEHCSRFDKDAHGVEVKRNGSSPCRQARQCSADGRQIASFVRRHGYVWPMPGKNGFIDAAITEEFPEIPDGALRLLVKAKGQKNG